MNTFINLRRKHKDILFDREIQSGSSPMERQREKPKLDNLKAKIANLVLAFLLLELAFLLGGGLLGLGLIRRKLAA